MRSAQDRRFSTSNGVACHVCNERQRVIGGATPVFPFAPALLLSAWLAMSALLSALRPATLQLPRDRWPAMSALSPGSLCAFSACRPAMSLIFACNILCTAVSGQVEMACHVSSPAWLNRCLLVSPRMFVPGFYVCEGLPCLHIKRVGYDKGWNKPLVGGVPCPLARFGPGAGSAAWCTSASGEAAGYYQADCSRLG